MKVTQAARDALEEKVAAAIEHELNERVFHISHNAAIAAARAALEALQSTPSELEASAYQRGVPEWYALFMESE
jgi:hypothetical protein